jgi:hypothetical protein
MLGQLWEVRGKIKCYFFVILEIVCLSMCKLHSPLITFGCSEARAALVCEWPSRLMLLQSAWCRVSPTLSSQLSSLHYVHYNNTRKIYFSGDLYACPDRSL